MKQITCSKCGLKLNNSDFFSYHNNPKNPDQYSVFYQCECGNIEEDKPK